MSASSTSTVDPRVTEDSLDATRKLLLALQLKFTDSTEKYQDVTAMMSPPPLHPLCLAPSYKARMTPENYQKLVDKHSQHLMKLNNTLHSVKDATENYLTKRREFEEAQQSVFRAHDSGIETMRGMIDELKGVHDYAKEHSGGRRWMPEAITSSAAIDGGASTDYMTPSRSIFGDLHALAPNVYLDVDQSQWLGSTRSEPPLGMPDFDDSMMTSSNIQSGSSNYGVSPVPFARGPPSLPARPIVDEVEDPHESTRDMMTRIKLKYGQK